MSLLTEAVAQEQQRIKRMISQYETELSCLPKGVLITKSIKGNQYFYLQYRNGKYNGEPYDIVFGPVANDTIYRTFIAYVSYFGQASDGIRVGQWDLSVERMKEIPFLVPPRDEQDQIVRFLDWKVSSVNRLIGIRELQIAELEELKRAIIRCVVTKGVNPNVEFKNSGEKWIGYIPNNWNLTKIKRKCKIIGSGTTPSTGNASFYNVASQEILMVAEEPVSYGKKRDDD